MEDSKVNKKYNPCIVPTSLIKSCARGLQSGLDKGYQPKSYLHGDIDTYKNALYRHLLSYLEGNLVDKESGLSVLDHLSANIAILIELEEQGKKTSEVDKELLKKYGLKLEEQKTESFTVQIVCREFHNFKAGMLARCIEKNGKYYVQIENGTWATVDLDNIHIYFDGEESDING